MTFPTKRSAQPTRGRTITLFAIWSSIGMTVAGFAAAAFVSSHRPADRYALCTSSALSAVATTTILIDATDTFTQTQQRRLKTTVDAERERLPHGGRLIVLSLNPEAPWEPTQHASVCNPGKAEESNPLFVTRSKIEQRWQAAFADPIDKAIEQAVTRPTSDRSPIIISIAALMTRADFDARVVARRLVIVSDLLEHDKGSYTQLRGGDFWTLYQSSPLPRSARLDLRGVQVAIDYLQRGKFAELQGQRHQAFWQRLFKEAGADDVSFLGNAPSLPVPTTTHPATNTPINGRP